MKTMNKKNVSKRIRASALIVSILVASLSLSYIVLAAPWSGPTAAPPGNNADIPLNVSGTSQIKGGGLILNTGGAPNGLAVANGNVGIGTTTPGAKLHVWGDTGWTQETLENTNASKGADLHIKADAAEYSIAVGGSASGVGKANKFWIAKESTGEQRFVIDDDGNVGIGTTTPSQKLEIKGEGEPAISIVSASDSYDANPLILGFRARGTNAARLPVAVDDTTLEFQGSGWDGAGFNGSVRIQANVDGAVASGRVPGRIDFITRSNDGSLSKKMVIKADGNVGIGTKTPGDKLEISGDGEEFGASIITASPTGWLNPLIQGYRSRGTISGKQATVIDDTVLEIQGLGHDGVDFKPAVRIYMQQDGPTQAGRIPGRIDFATTSNGLPVAAPGYVAPSTKMTIKADGNVGIGMMSPAKKLDVVGEIHATADICTDAGGGKCLSAAGGGGGFWAAGTGANINDIYNSNAGNVGIGTATPNAKLSVVTNNNEDSSWYSYSNTADSDFDFIVNRARGTSVAPLPVDSTNNLGSLRFHGLESVGGNFLHAALIEASVDGTPGVGDMPAKLRFSTRSDGVGGVLTERMTIKNDGNVGIGTMNPRTRLELSNDGAILATGTYNSGWIEQNLGAGTRLLWYPRKAAFRVGQVNGTQWDDVNIGKNSFAGGLNSMASSDSAFAFGEGSTAESWSSVAMGPNNHALNGGAVALGRNSRSTAENSFTMGEDALASGFDSVALGGFQTRAIADYSIAIGNGASASGSDDVAIGRKATTAGYGSTAIGYYIGTAATANYSMTLGRGVSAVSYLTNNIANSLAIGFNSTVPTLFVGPSAGAGTTGNVGIGTTNPISPLHVFSSTGVGPEIRVQATEPTRSADMHFQSDGREWAFGVGGSGVAGRPNKFFIIDQTANAGSGLERFIIDTDGNVGIGTTGPIAKMDLDMTNLTTTEGLHISRDAAASHYAYLNIEDELTVPIFKVHESGNVGIGVSVPSEKLDVAGNVSAIGFFYSSDERLKDNIFQIENPLEKILKLNGVTFNWKNSGESSIGFTAQNVETVFPELVKTDKTSGMKSVEYGNLVAPLIEAIKEQQKMIENQQREIELLKKQIIAN